ncbi:MAG: type II secretion system protein [Burkholderiaceae bacterium]
MRRGEADRARRPKARGFTFVALLAAVAVITLGLSVTAPTWADKARRERERELMRIGELYAHALADYREGSPGGLKTWPRSLDELALDKRFFGVRRHLRRLYPDPLDPARPWGLVRDLDGGIVGVYSQSTDRPAADGPVVLGDLVLAPARRYCDWKFSPKDPT